MSWGTGGLQRATRLAEGEAEVVLPLGQRPGWQWGTEGPLELPRGGE